MRTRFAKALAATALAATALVGCGANSTPEGGPVADESGVTTVRLGVTDSAKKQWPVLQEKAAAEDINLELVHYNDYVTPNRALAEGAIDANQYQHLLFLADNQLGTGQELVPIASTEIFPLPLYWKGHDSTEGIDGETVAIPNDPTNGGRAIRVLEQAGLVTLRDGAPISPTPADIVQEESRVSVNQVDPTQTAVVWGEGTPAVVNQNFIDRAGIDPATAIAADDPKDPATEPYINVWVTRAGDEDNTAINRLAELWHSPEVQEAVAEDTGFTSVSVKKSREELKGILDGLIEKLRTENDAAGR
ncbi:MetQ/NlpA family ABC transporter substrate-binding protein [Corynebacterium sp. 335C]